MRSLWFVLSLLLVATPVHALTQPDGTVIPQTTALQQLFDSRSERINALADAADMPERFVPGCTLTFTVVSRGQALFQNSFGWYNVNMSGAPPDSDLHILLPCTAGVGASATLDLRTDPNYLGGEIGFFLRTPEDGTCQCCAAGNCCADVTSTGHTYYTEREFNPDNTGATATIHLLIYDSSVTPRAFYFAWEDLFGGGDNEFMDLVAEVTNIQCSGGGMSCDTGRSGICAAGTTQCHDGALTCVENVQPRARTCNGLDNDCDGTIDDGPCPAGTVCARGACIPLCVESGCFAGETCTSAGICVENDCVSVTCNAGQHCVGGQCVGLCDGVVCPQAQACEAGRCIDPCAGLTCDADQVCVMGVCQPKCPCRRCATDETCQSDGTCVSTACLGVSCVPGMICVSGNCQDACSGVQCPTGQMCMSGQCVAATMSADAGPDGGDAAVDAHDATSDHAVEAGADSGDVARIDGAADTGGFGMTRGGCACGVQRTDSSGVSALAMIGLAIARRRARRRRSQGAGARTNA